MPLKSFFQKKSNVLALGSFIAIVAISLMKSAMELEDAEQAYFSQWLRLGYDDQPPLYTWLQYGLNTVLGLNVVSFSILRGLIFALILVILHRYSTAYLKDISKSNLVLFSLALIPVFIDFTFRRLSHTSLLCLVVIITYFILQKLITEKTLRNYILFGLFVGIGILTKYNFIMVIGGIVLSVFIDKGVRQVILHKYIVLSFLIATLAITPHFYWLFSNQNFLNELSASVELKTMVEGNNSIPVLSPILAMLLNILKIVAPIFILLIIFSLFKKVKFSIQGKDWLNKMFVAQLIVILLFFVLMDVQKTEERWFLPLLLPFLPLPVKSITFINPKKWEIYGFTIFMLIIVVQTIRTPVEKVLNIPSDVHFGFQLISDKLNSKFENEKWILPNVTYAGNIKLLNPSKDVYASDDFSLPELKTNKKVVTVILGNDLLENHKPVDSIIGFGRRKVNIYFLE